ncbi:hypothetical protein [Bifidobacterium biavatii]|uniref:Uncharacterized protein n=1 Tax=Bifidobacterium biavatii DSM 23969 TaxID=1437608 RepID=A0A087A124_9BIFI|nr:hypothetical protein [Bifidobacterium biavatii]KFI52474.1 hypothetical protein BBIA_0898 [Bifidobacterium biavatii DSM 23969]
MKRLTWTCNRENVRTYARLGTRIGGILVVVSWISVAYTVLIEIGFILCLFNPWLLTTRDGDVTSYGLQFGNGFFGMAAQIAGVRFQFHDGGLPLVFFGLAGVANAYLNVLVASGARDLCVAIGTWAGGESDEATNAGADGLTPFCADAQHGLERIGWGLILKPVIAGVMSVASVLFVIVGSPVGVSLEFFSMLEYILAGALMFLLSFVFGYGATLQRDVDGLL